jgi:hypothetical protein
VLLASRHRICIVIVRNGTFGARLTSLNGLLSS